MKIDDMKIKNKNSDWNDILHKLAEESRKVNDRIADREAKIKPTILERLGKFVFGDE